MFFFANESLTDAAAAWLCRCCCYCLGIAPRAKVLKISAWLLHPKWLQFRTHLLIGAFQGFCLGAQLLSPFGLNFWKVLRRSGVALKKKRNRLINAASCASCNPLANIVRLNSTKLSVSNKDFSTIPAFSLKFSKKKTFYRRKCR